jgi:hypothetical protein
MWHSKHKGITQDSLHLASFRLFLNRLVRGKKCPLRRRSSSTSNKRSCRHSPPIVRDVQFGRQVLRHMLFRQSSQKMKGEESSETLVLFPYVEAVCCFETCLPTRLNGVTSQKTAMPWEPQTSRCGVFFCLFFVLYYCPFRFSFSFGVLVGPPLWSSGQSS